MKMRGVSCLSCLIWLCVWCSRSSWAEDDTACLKNFKSSVRDALNSLADWDFTNGSVCSMVGVTCWNTQENKVYSLQLPGMGLTWSSGPNSPFTSLGHCSSLTTLELSDNSFTGPLPSDLCEQLPYLNVLNLSHNRFQGTIPPDLGNCTYLHSLALQSNNLSGNIPSQLGNLPHLTYLNLSSNALSGHIPSTLTNRSIPFDAASFDNNPLLFMPKCRASKLRRNLLLICASILLAFLLFIAILFALQWPHKLPALLKQYLAFRSHGDNSSSQWVEAHLKVTWEEVERATSFFSPANIIGSGGSSTVYKGWLPDGQEIAVKVLQNEDVGLQLRTPKQLFLTELVFLGKLRHRNLVKVLGFCCNSESMAIILEYMPAGSLDALLCHKSATSNLAFGWKPRLNILLGIAEGLAYLHKEYDGKLSVIHGDLKPGNVLLDEYMEAHIADFGIATFVSTMNSCSAAASSNGQVLSMPCWSLGYTAPECVQQGLGSCKGDVFSFGVIVLEMITGERPSSDKLKEGESLVEWVSEALAEDSVDRVIAPLLLSVKEMTRLREDLNATLRMGCSCASMVRAKRPDMFEVVNFLRRICEKLEDNPCSTWEMMEF